jgi:C_GCAxxG_C_C family probable redox protein
MKPTKDYLINSFQSGLNCAQSVLASYSEELGFDKNLALNISCGFGGGMGRLQETCGAVTGAFMVIGIYNSDRCSDIRKRKEKTYLMIRDFNKRFISIHKTTNCKLLLNCDLKTEEGQKFAIDNRLYETVCGKCMYDSISIINDLFDEEV